MTNTELFESIRAALVTRYDYATTAGKRDVNQALNSLALYPANFTINGLRAIAKASDIEPPKDVAKDKKVEWKMHEIIRRIALTDKAVEGWMTQKNLDKVIRMAQYLGGATEADALNSDKMNSRKGLIDSFVSLLFVRIAFMGQFPRNEKGQIMGKRPEVAMSNDDGTCMVSGFSLSKIEFESILNVDRWIDSTDCYEPEKTAQMWAEGGQKFDESTAKTQVSQIRTVLTALGCATSKKNQKPSAKEGVPMLTMNPDFTALVVAAVKKNPIPLEWMKSPNTPKTC